MFSSPETSTLILWTDFCVIIFSFIPFFFLSGAVSCYGRYLQITFCFHVSLVFKIYIWYKGAAVGLAGCFLICFSVVENVSLIVLSRTSYFKIDFSYMQ